MGRVVLKHYGITEEIPEFQDLREVDAMLEERAAQWKDEYIRQGVMIGKAEGISIGETRGLGLALRDLLEARFGTLPQSVTSYIASSSDSNALRKLTLSAYHAESLQAFIDQLKRRYQAHVIVSSVKCNAACILFYRRHFYFNGVNRGKNDKYTTKFKLDISDISPLTPKQFR